MQEIQSQQKLLYISKNKGKCKEIKITSISCKNKNKILCKMFAKIKNLALAPLILPAHNRLRIKVVDRPPTCQH